jgi:hypothetical protein
MDVTRGLDGAVLLEAPLLRGQNGPNPR